MLIGLQVGDGHLLGSELLGELKARGFDLIRIQAFMNDRGFPLTTPERTRELVEEVIDAGLRPYVMIRRAEQIAAIPPDYPIIEFGNEPDLGAQFGWPSFREYMAELRRVIVAADGRNPLWTGVVSNLNVRGFDFLEQMRWSSIPDWVGCAVHRYPDGDEREPKKASKDRRFRGAGHRDREVEELKRIVGVDRPLGLSEIGYHTARGQSDEQVADNMRWERTFWQRHAFHFAIAYQLNDGPNRSQYEQCFGFRYFAEGDPWPPRWKPVLSAWTVRA